MTFFEKASLRPTHIQISADRRKDICLLRVNRVDFTMSTLRPLILEQRTCYLAIDPLVPLLHADEGRARLSQDAR